VQLRAESAVAHTIASMSGKDAWLVTLEAPLAPGTYAWHTAKALELRIFGGVPPERIAEALDISPTQAKRDVAFARAWLVAQLTDGPQPPRGAGKERPTP
jgi:hypothetical protein